VFYKIIFSHVLVFKWFF